MPNVDKATRILNRASTDEFVSLSNSEKEKIFKEFVTIPSNQKPTSFRNAGSDEMKKFMYELNSNLKKTIREAYRFNAEKIVESSKNNLVDSDIVIINKQEEINGELKFGEETNSNIGNSTMDTIFKFEGITFAEIAKTIQSKQRKFVITDGNFDELKVLKNLDCVLDEVVKKLETSIDVNQVKIDSKAIEKLLTISGSLAKANDHKTIKIRIDFSQNSENQIKPMNDLRAEGEWTIMSLKKTENSSRIEIKCTNGIMSCKFLLNWKNNYPIKGKKEKAPSKWGLGSSSWNVWTN